MNKTRMGKRAASLLLSLVMMLSLLPTAAYATMADGVDTQGASVSENGTGVSDDSNSSGGTDDLQVGDSEGSGDTDDQKVGDSSVSGTTNNTAGAEGGADTTGSVDGNVSTEGTTTYVAYIDEVGYETLDAAITDARDGDTVEVAEGSYTLNGSLTYTGKAITVKAANGANVIFDMSSAVTLSGAKITFENVTFNYTNADYTGLQHTDTVVYNNCTINGKMFLYANSETFNDCHFVQTSEDYNVWTYGAKKVAFNDCTFKCNGKAVNVYIEKGNASDDAKTIEVNSCIVNSTKENKAFLNIKNSTQAYDVTLSGTNTVNGLTADGTTGSALYQVETTKVTETTGNPVTVKAKAEDGTVKTVYEVKETVAETPMDLDAFIKAVEASGYNYDGNGVTVKWSPATGCYDTREGHACTANNVKATGNTPKRVSADYAQYQLFSGLTQNVTIKNVKFVYEPAAFTICANSGWAGSGTVTNLAELQFENKGDVKLLDCSFDGVAVAVFNDIETASTVVHGCSFTNMTKAGGGYAIHYLKGGKIDVSENTFENVYRGMLVQSTVNKGTNIVNNNFSGIDATNSSCYMVKLLNVKDTDIVISGNTTAANAPVNVNVAYDGTDGAAIAVGDRISTIHTAETDGNGVAISTGGNQMTGYTAPSAAVEDASGITVDADGNVTVTLPAKTTSVAEVNGVKYDSLQAAIDKATEEATVILLADTRENVTISTNRLTLDLNGHTLNGGTVAGKPALTVRARNVIVKDSSEAKTGTIMREDTAENSGAGSHYVIDIQGDNAFLKFEGGNVKNNSGNKKGNGASLVRVGDDSVSAWPQLTIAGGTFTQDNFIVIKVDRGTFYLTGGTLNSKNDYAVENWSTATIKGGTVNGTVAAWTYSGGQNSNLSISDNGIVNGDVASVSYDKAEGKLAKVSITGGTVNGTLGTYTYDSNSGKSDATTDATKATIAVTGGTFSKDPTKYVVEDSGVTKNTDGTYGVAKAYLAKVGNTSYYTMEEAFKAQTTSGEAIVLLRDYTTGSTFNSGSIDRTVDLAGHTWTCTGTDANSAAFEINYSDASLTVKNGKVFSSQLVGLIPSAMGGTIKYDNSTLVFDGVEMTTTARSGIETNGNNTNDTVTLKNSTLNVSEGFGIYFPSSGTLTIDNSVINAKTMGVQVCSGSLNISGAGTAITVSGDGIDKTINDGAIEDGAAISIVNRPGYKGLSKIEVTGGTFTAKSGNAAVKAYKWEDQTASAFDNSKNVVAISGGTFSSVVDKSLCADGFIPTKNADGTYGVKEGADGYVEDENGNVTISTAEGLFYFAKKVNAGNNFAGKTVTLANNIDLNDELWTPIGSFNDATTQFKGTFDGQNHAVTGLKVEESRKNGVGFFSKVYTGTIKNLTVEGSVSAPGCTYVGGIVGHGYATITNCTFKGTVSGSGAAQVGGIAGSGGFTVTNCSVYGDVSAGCWAGGIVGNCQDGGAYTNCYVEGTISSERTYWGGGAAGITPVPLYPSQVISGCYSNTVVKVAGEEVNCPIIAAYNNPLDHDGYSGGLKIYDNSWNKQKNSNDSYPIYAEKDGKGGVLMEGMTAARDNSLIMLEDDLNYVTGDLSKVRIMAGSSVTQAQIDALAVASVGDSKYQSLAEAIDAAQDGQTVTLLADATEDVVISKSITLDLGGKTLTNTNAGKATISVQSGTVTVKNGNVVGGTDYYNIEAKKDANLTLTDVTATAGNNGSSMIDNYGTLTITSGTYTGGLDTVKNEPSAKLNITGGTFTLTKGTSKGFTGVVFNYGELTISGGEFIQSDKSAPWGQAQVIHTDKSGSAAPSTVITGGTFKNLCTSSTTAWTVRATNAAAGATKVSGGAFNKSVKDYYCAEGFIPTSTKDADGNYGVKVGKYVAEVGSKKYETLADAIRLAGKGKTITLLADVEQNTQLTINKSITLDLNGKTIKNTVDIWSDNANAILSITNGAKVTITGNGTIDAKENDCYTINVVKGDLTIENGTFYGNVSVVQVEEGSLSVKGGNFDLHQKWEGSSKYLFNCIDSEFTSGNAKVAISGGTFVGFDPNVSPEQKVDGKVPSFAAPGAGITKNEDGSFTAAAGMTAQILDKDGNSVNAYKTLTEAVAAAEDGQTVRLLADVTLNEQIATGKAITIDGQGKYTIKAAKKLVAADGKAGMFYRTQSAKGTLTFLNVTLDGGGVSKIFLNEGGAGETVFDGVTSTNGGGIAYGSGIHISGGGSHATIRNSKLTGSTGTTELNDANYYAANDLWVGGNVYVTVENSVIGTVFVNSAPSATATNGVVHGQLTITGENTKITYLSGEEEAADKLDKFGNNGSLVKIDSGYVEKVFDKGSYAISGGTFKTEVKKEWCAAGYVPTQNGDGTYGVEVGKFTVMVTSRTTGSDSPVANVAGGGSDITYAQGTTVTASAISGYKFVGWFVNEYTGTPYSTDLTCEVKPTDDWTMIAVYEPISGGKFWLTVTASEFTVNGGAVQDSYLYEQFAVGASVTVNFTGSENFLYWVNASNKVVSTEKSYTFIMGSETTLKAVYGKARQNQATVVFISHSDQIISSKAYTTSDTIQFPVPPIKMGCTFTGWSMTEAEIRAAMANNSGIIQVRALYTEPSIACKVTVIYPDGIGNEVVNAVVGKAVNVTAKDIEGKTFSYWTDNDGNVLGYTKTLKLAPSGDMTVKAVYDEAAEVKPVITISEVSATTANESYVVTFMATRAVPDGYKVVKQGILWSRDAVCGEDGAAAYMQFDSNGKLPNGVNAYIGNSSELNGVTRLDITTKYNDRTFYGRGYMVLESDAGELLYIYTNTIASGSYDSLTK